VHRNGLRLLKLVSTLLDFSRIESGRVQASFVLTDLSTLPQSEEQGEVRLAVQDTGSGISPAEPWADASVEIRGLVLFVTRSFSGRWRSH
jgi:hypothetical protein